MREYESILLLQEELRRRGYTAEIHQLLGRKAALLSVSPKGAGVELHVRQRGH